MKTPDLYRESPDRLKMYLNENQIKRLLGHRGCTINLIRKKHRKNTIFVNSKISKYYVEFSGQELTGVYRDILWVLN